MECFRLTKLDTERLKKTEKGIVLDKIYRRV